MLFNSWIYAAFLAGTFAVYWSLPGHRARQWLLALAGLVFYAHWFPPHVVLICSATIGLFAATVVADRIAARAGSRILVGAIIACLSILAYYKYQGFVLDTLIALGLPRGELWISDVRAPLAVSFFTFEYVHYLIELRRGTIRRGSFADFFLFIMFFPTLICGPIKRFHDFQPQIDTIRWETDRATAGLGRIVVGLAKKVVVADVVAGLIAPIWAEPDAHSAGALWLGTYGYAMQIYFDFAGYSDIAIGSAALFGYHVPENFNAPYRKVNIAEFWRSWHMSLTSWITDYVYIPLGGNRRGPWRGHVNRLTAMTLCGLWHGAAWHFALWGLYHGIGLTIFRAYRNVRLGLDPSWTPGTGPIRRGISTMLTFHFTCVGWVLFVADFETAATVIPRLFLLR